MTAAAKTTAAKTAAAKTAAAKTAGKKVVVSENDSDNDEFFHVERLSGKRFSNGHAKYKVIKILN